MLNNIETSWAFITARLVSYLSHINTSTTNETVRVVYIPYVRNHPLKKVESQPSNIYLFKGNEGSVTTPIETVRVSGGSSPLIHRLIEVDNHETENNHGLTFNSANAQITGKLSDNTTTGPHTHYVDFRNTGEGVEEADKSRGFKIYVLDASNHTINKRHGDTAPTVSEILNAPIIVKALK